MEFALEGKVALVTGGARDVGREIALGLAAEGASVVVNYHGSKAGAEAVVAEIEGRGGRALAIRCDISDRAQVDAMVAQTVETYGGLNILVNNAGLVIRKRFVETTPEEWRKQIDVCLYGTLNCTHAALPHLEAQKGTGRIISIMGDSSRVGESGLAIGAAARAANIALMKSVARETRSGTTANSIALGLIETAHDPEFIEASREKLTRLYPLRRLGQPEDVAPMVVLLASARGSWVTGQVISVSGGFSMV
ncbi:SDR family NAD(P)-dependent oxidoreductase [Cupriavidus consociatus]|uniref:SDR family NAD(P)-dependent oxidoreductase n=1 Tax=Cupriavidus consociatus TaxID=2821357 RepID=UPI001AE597EF|nr:MULTISPECIES: SDR family oxidoreductase [unclassified Cupriavidus]MBP0623758.1 SDR family oxidoreductase [Cupriavidus sp. LEh25]MDK2660465.1 SDR family oxidoreductase [Cupriavidus sp. LEh21]